MDKIDITVKGLTSYSQLAITDTAQGAQVAFGTDTILFQNLTAAQLTQDNFVLHG